MFLKKLKLKPVAWPKLPSFLPLYPPPTAWQASSTTNSLCLRARRISLSMSLGRPTMCTGMIALV